MTVAEELQLFRDSPPSPGLVSKAPGAGRPWVESMLARIRSLGRQQPEEILDWLQDEWETVSISKLNLLLNALSNSPQSPYLGVQVISKILERRDLDDAARENIERLRRRILHPSSL
jgi:hypothetical protein